MDSKKLERIMRLAHTGVTKIPKAALRTRQSCGFFMPVIYGRVERRNKIPVDSGNMPGVSFGTLVDTRLPATNWKSLTEIQKEALPC